MFHSITTDYTLTNESQLTPENHLPADLFEDIISRVSSKYTPLSIKEALQISKSSLPGIVVTFDDGFRDNLNVALPILEKYKVPALVNVTSGFVEQSEFPFEYHLASIIENSSEISFYYEQGRIQLSTSDQKKKQEAYTYTKNILKFASDKNRQHTLKQLDRECKFKPIVQYLSIKELRELSNTPLITIGSHTHYHQVLTALPEASVINDLEKGKKMLENWIDRSLIHFSYPYGAYNKKVVKLYKIWDFNLRLQQNQVLNNMVLNNR